MTVYGIGTKEWINAYRTSRELIDFNQRKRAFGKVNGFVSLAFSDN